MASSAGVTHAHLSISFIVTEYIPVQMTGEIRSDIWGLYDSRYFFLHILNQYHIVLGKPIVS